jgi:hypothetical protein
MLKSRLVSPLVGILGIILLTPGWATDSTGENRMTIGVAFETLQTEYWVASLEAIRSDLDLLGRTQ